MNDESAEARSFRLRAAERAHHGHRRAVAGAFAPLVAMSADILKAVSFINGGAAVATLVFVAEVLRERPALALALVLPLAIFGFGLTVAGCATGFSYFAQEQDAKALRLRDLVSIEPFVADTDASRAAALRGERYRRFGLVAVFVSIASAVGGFSAAGIILILFLR